MSGIPKRLRLVLATAAMLLAAGSCGPAAPPPGILLITVDTLRADHLAAWGRPGAFTPNLDALIAESTAFPVAIAPRSQTWPTLASVLTAREPVVHAVRRNGQPMAEDIPTLAEHLGARGYECAAFLSNSGQAGWRGFDPVADWRDQDRRVLDGAKGWLRAKGSAPFFLWVHFFGPHRPFDADAPWTERFDPGYAGPIDGSIEQMRSITLGDLSPTPADVRHMIARYDAEIAQLDRRVGELLRHLERLGLAGNTVVAFTSDHGEELYERHRYWSHSASIYDTVLHVPLSFRAPGRIPAGQLRPGLAASIDVAPTLLALAGREPMGSDGVDLAAVFAGGAPLPAGRVVYSELEDLVVSARTQRWRYLHNPEGNGFPMEGGETGLVFPYGEVELYDHATDPGEKRDRSGVEPERVDEFLDATEEWMRGHDWEGASRRHRDSHVPDAIRESLEAIGYLN